MPVLDKIMKAEAQAESLREEAKNEVARMLDENNKDNAIITNKLISGLYPFKITAVTTPITEAAQIPMIFKTTRLLSYSYFSLMIAKDNLPMPL